MLLLRTSLSLLLLPLIAFASPILPGESIIPTKTFVSPRAQWQHPGYVVGKAQLYFIKSQVAAGAQPWTAAYKQMLLDKDKYGPYASGDRTSGTTPTVSCGPTTTPDTKCTDERGDALASWANALAWYVSGNTAYAKNAIALMNKWSYVIKGHALYNAVLQTAWAGASWARAGELIRYTTTNLWAAADITQFGNMLSKVYLPSCINGDTRASNWDVACLKTAICIAVFTENSTAYSHAMTLFQEAVPYVIYLNSDGSLPVPARGLDPSASAQRTRWFGQQTWGNPSQNGQMQETCRDLAHTGYSISSISHILETSRIQGMDQYTGDLGTRLRYALGFHAQFEQGVVQPSWLCQGHALTRTLEYVTEIGYNALATRLGNNMLNTLAYTEKVRPQGTNSLFYGWETLTHAGNQA